MVVGEALPRYRKESRMTTTYYRTALNHFDPSGNPVLCALGMPVTTICEAIDEIDACAPVIAGNTEATVYRFDRAGEG